MKERIAEIEAYYETNGRLIPQDVRWLITRAKGAATALPSAAKVLTVEVFYLETGEEAFICGANGHLTVGTLQELEEDLRSEDHKFTEGEGTYLYKAVRQGPDEGCPPYWELEQTGFVPLVPSGEVIV